MAALDQVTGALSRRVLESTANDGDSLRRELDALRREVREWRERMRAELLACRGQDGEP
jgi:FtsZ-binding cell division protein ZapB